MYFVCRVGILEVRGGWAGDLWGGHEFSWSTGAVEWAADEGSDEGVKGTWRGCCWVSRSCRRWVIGDAEWPGGIHSTLNIVRLTLKPYRALNTTARGNKNGSK